MKLVWSSCLEIFPFILVVFMSRAFRCTNGDFYVVLGSSMVGTFGLGRWWSVKAGFVLFL